MEQITQAEFWQTLRDCLGKLPERIAAVFTLREMDELETEEICRMLSISPNTRKRPKRGSRRGRPLQ